MLCITQSSPAFAQISKREEHYSTLLTGLAVLDKSSLVECMLLVAVIIALMNTKVYQTWYKEINITLN